MTAIWSWADFGDHVLQRYTMRQYWLILSVLSVKKFNPSWRRVFICDQITYEFIKDKNWIELWDEIKIVDFSDTEYGNLYDIKIYSWPKIYSYGLIEDNIIMIDIDIVFINSCNIIDKYRIGGKFYNHIDDFDVNGIEYANLSYKWNDIEDIQRQLLIDTPLTQDDTCLVGSPIYCPKHLTKSIQNIIPYIIKLENQFGGLLPNDTFCELEEEWPIAKIGHDNGGIWEIDYTTYKHGYTSQCYNNITEGIKKPEDILQEKVYEKYIKPYETSSKFF